MTATLLASLDDFAAARGVDLDPTDLTAIIALEGASAAVQTYTGQTIAFVEVDTIRVHGTGTQSLLLPQVPVGTITDVTVTDLADVDTVLTEDIDFVVERDSGILWRTGFDCWTRGRLNVSVTYDHGFDPVPGDIQRIVMALAGRDYARSLAGGRVVTSETLGPYSVTFDSATATATLEGGLEPEEKAVLDRYRMDRVA